MERGEIIAAQFKGDKYLEFINFCFVNVLISGVDVKIVDINVSPLAWEYILFIRIAAPGIDRIDRAIVKFEGSRIL